MYDLEITPCKCWMAPCQLLEQGLFPSAPRRPGLAVDIRLLEFTRKLFVRIAPNKSAMVGALEEHLGDLGFKLPNDVCISLSVTIARTKVIQDSMRRQFPACLEWYTHLRDRVDAHVDRVLEVTRKCQLSADAVEDDNPEHSVPSSAQGNAQPPPETPLPPRPQASPTPGDKRKRESTPEEEENPFPDPEARARPSEYLRARCPACFGGDFKRGAGDTGDM
jgi:hypothetical protein